MIISAYVGQAVVAELLDLSAQATKRALYARWDIKDVASGASDWRVWDVASARSIPFFACSRLHAKIYLADDRALVGSANATGPGFGIGTEPNLELLIEVDAHHTSVMEVVQTVQDTAVIASPIGPDVTKAQTNGEEENGTPQMPIWLPRSEPQLFLNAMTGIGSHDNLTRQDCESMGLVPSGTYSRNAIRYALRDMTAFRIVRHEFETRMNPMGLSDLCALLVKCVGDGLAKLRSDDVLLLARWLGQYGANTIATPSPSGDELELNPGMLLGSDDEFDG